MGVQEAHFSVLKMKNGKLVFKLACLVGYLLFASLSAYFTATSLSLNLLNGTNVWLIFVLVLVISILAGWCLTNVINEMRKRVGASRSGFVLNLLGFLVFWLFSFTTNVHYFFVEKHGYTILTKELASAKQYIFDNTSKANKTIDEKQNTAIQSLIHAVGNNASEFQREIRSTINGRHGFGDNCISYLRNIERILRQDSQMYGDGNKYIIYGSEDEGDRGTTQRGLINGLEAKYLGRIETEKQKKLAVIKNYYERKKDQNIELTEMLDTITIYEKDDLARVLKDGSVTAFFQYNEKQNGNVIAKMPADYAKYAQKTEVYPSNRMFDTISVWSDLFKGRLGDMTMLQWIIIALICDLVAFLLFTLFRNYESN